MSGIPFGPPGALPLVEASGVGHVYETDGRRVVALDRVDLDLQPGERLAIMGPTGSGKTTLLNILAGLENPTSGRLVVAGHELGRLTGREREAFRRRVVGYVWQRARAGLLPALTVLQNVQLPMLAEGRSATERLDLAFQLLEALRLGSRAGDRLADLTAVEVQRLAAAVALANRPLLLLADELTAGLDWPTGGELFTDVLSLLGSTGTAAVIVSHDQRVRRYVDRVVMIREGVAVQSPSPMPVLSGGPE